MNKKRSSKDPKSARIIGILTATEHPAIVLGYCVMSIEVMP